MNHWFASLPVGCRWSTPSSNATPMGRSLHDVYIISRNDVIIYGGRQVRTPSHPVTERSRVANACFMASFAQIRQSNALLDVHRLRVLTDEDELGTQGNIPRIEWSSPPLKGSLPNGRRGHSTNAVGENLLLFGGQDGATGQLENDVRVLEADLATGRCPWRRAVPSSRLQKPVLRHIARHFQRLRARVHERQAGTPTARQRRARLVIFIG